MCLQFLWFLIFFFMVWSGHTCLVFFSFSLNTNSKSSLLMHHVNWQSAPTFSCFLFPRCHLLQNHRNKLEGEWIIFLPFYFCPLFSFLKRSLSQSCYYVNQLFIVSHFCLPGDIYWVSWMQIQLSSYSVKRALPPYINLLCLVCLLIIKSKSNLTKVKEVFTLSLFNDWSSTEGKEETDNHRCNTPGCWCRWGKWAHSEDSTQAKVHLRTM